MKVLAKVECKRCNGLGKVISTNTPDYFRLNADGTERCFWCEGKGYAKEWIDTEIIVKENLRMQKLKAFGLQDA